MFGLGDNDSFHKRVKRLQYIFLLEPEVLEADGPHLISSDSLLGVVLQHLMDYFIESRTVPLRYILEPDRSLFAYKLVDSAGLIWHPETAQFVDNNAQRPYIAFLVVPFFFEPYLRASIER